MLYYLVISEGWLKVTNTYLIPIPFSHSHLFPLPTWPSSFQVEKLAQTVEQKYYISGQQGEATIFFFFFFISKYCIYITKAEAA